MISFGSRLLIKSEFQINLHKKWPLQFQRRDSINTHHFWVKLILMIKGQNLLVKQRFLRVSHVWVTQPCIAGISSSQNFKSNWARNGHYSSNAPSIMTIFEWNDQMMGGHDLNCNWEPLRDHWYGYKRKSLLKYSRRCGGKTALKLFDSTGKKNHKTNFKSNWARDGHYSSNAKTPSIMTIFEWNDQMMGGHDLNCNREPLRDHGYGYKRKSLLKYSRRCGGKTTLKLFDLTGKK